MEDPTLLAARKGVHDAALALGNDIQPIVDRFTALQGKLDGSMTPAEQTAAAQDMQNDITALQATSTALIALGTQAPAPPA